MVASPRGQLLRTRNSSAVWLLPYGLLGAIVFTAGLWPSLSHRPAALAIALCAGVVFSLLVLAVAASGIRFAAAGASPINLRRVMGDLRLMGLVLFVLACAAALRLQLAVDAPQSADLASAGESRAFDRWRTTAIPAMLAYQRALRNTPILAGRIPKRSERVRLLAQSRLAGSLLAELARSARARPPSSDAGVRHLQSMLWRAARQGAIAEASYARGVLQSRADLLGLAKREVEQSAALMVDLTLRANAFGTQMAPASTG